MIIDNGAEDEAMAAEAVGDDVEAAGDVTTEVATLTPDQSDAVDMIRGRVHSGLVGFDADRQLTILETVRATLNEMIDRIIDELTGDDDEGDDETEHEYVWGPLEESRLAGTLHRKCQVEGCRVINALDDETDDDEYEPVSRCPACGQPIDYCQGHGESGDPDGWLILAMHDDGDHSSCAQEADCLGLAD